LLYILARSDVFAAMFRHDMEERRQVRTAMYIYLKQEGCVSLCEHNIWWSYGRTKDNNATH